jgi:hypothetical protein
VYSVAGTSGIYTRSPLERYFRDVQVLRHHAFGTHGLLYALLLLMPVTGYLQSAAELTSGRIITARVYRGTPLLGRTEILVRDPHLRPDGRC